MQTVNELLAVRRELSMRERGRVCQVGFCALLESTPLEVSPMLVETKE
jgi:hypothetical protein